MESISISIATTIYSGQLRLQAFTCASSSAVLLLSVSFAWLLIIASRRGRLLIMRQRNPGPAAGDPPGRGVSRQAKPIAPQLSEQTHPPTPRLFCFIYFLLYIRYFVDAGTCDLGCLVF